MRKLYVDKDIFKKVEDKIMIQDFWQRVDIVPGFYISKQVGDTKLTKKVHIVIRREVKILR